MLPSSGLHILDLPRELLLYTIERHLPRRDIFTLALVSSDFSHLIDYILYHSLILNNVMTLRLLGRTARTPAGGRKLGRNVENIFIGGPMRYYSTRDEDIISILSSLTQVQKFAIHESHLNALGRIPRNRMKLTPSHIEISSSSSFPPGGANLDILFSRCTHLSFSSPGEKWVEPLPFLHSLPLLRTISHIALSRREHSNTENDVIFTNCIASLLHHYPYHSRFKNLEQVVVKLFPANGDENDVDADIWNMLRERVVDDKRVLIKKGDWEGWTNEWTDDVTGVRCSWSKDE